MDPLDPECPKPSPNYYDVCPLLDKFLAYTQKNGIVVDYAIEEENEEDAYSFFDICWFFQSTIIWPFTVRNKRDVGSVQSAARTIPVQSVSSPNTGKVAEKNAEEKAHQCEKMRTGMMRWMSANKDKWSDFLQATEYPKYPDFGNIMKNGCPGFASEVLHWPTDMILGGVKRNHSTGPLTHADALQSVFLVASPNDVYLRFKERVSNLSFCLVWNTYAQMCKRVRISRL